MTERLKAELMSEDGAECLGFGAGVFAGSGSEKLKRVLIFDPARVADRAVAFGGLVKSRFFGLKSRSSKPRERALAFWASGFWAGGFDFGTRSGLMSKKLPPLLIEGEVNCGAAVEER